MTRHLCFVFSEQDGEKLGEYSAGISLRRSSLSEKILFWVQVMKRKREKFTILKEVSFVCKYRCIYLIYPIYLIPNMSLMYLHLIPNILHPYIYTITWLLCVFSLVVDRDLLKDTHTDDVKSMSDRVSRHVFLFSSPKKSFNRPFEFLLYKTNT